MFGGKSIIGKISKGGLNLGSVGESLNDITGVSSSARQQYKHQLALQKDAQEFAKWQMQNAHQMEVQDLKEAGLNPVLSAGAGGGASAGVSMGNTSTGTGADPISMIAGIINMSNSVKQTENAIKKTEADIRNETEMTNANVAKALAEAGYKQHEIDYYVDTGFFPGATKTVGNEIKVLGSGGSSTTTIPIKNNNRKKNSARSNSK